MSYKLGRPKRAAEDYARTHHDNGTDSQTSKKPRFDIRNPSALAPDAPEEDAILEADVIGKRGQQVRRNAVNVDGYDSDSDNENFNTRAEAKASAVKSAQESKEEDENDMFADLEEGFKNGDDSEGDADRKGGKGKKAVRFLNEDEIEGQVQNSKSGGHVSADFSLGADGSGKGKGKRKDIDQEVESSSDSEVDDETRADAGDVDEELGAGAKKIHAPKLDAFNMKSEQEEGRFDDQGNYVRKAVDPDAVHDNWLEGLSKKDMKKAKEAHDKREEERRQKDLDDDAKPTGEILTTLISHLEIGETTLEALARLGRSKSKKPKWQKNKAKQNGNRGDTQDAETAAVDAKRREIVESITEAADLLLTRGQPEIYDTERELLIRQYRRETGEEWAEPVAQSSIDTVTSLQQWEYRWADARDGGDIHGPYDGGTMKQWNDAGYFGDGVEFRQLDSTDEWSRLADFL